MIFQDEESVMITDKDSVGTEDQINDLSNSNELMKSGNRRKQVKPNRVTNEDIETPQQPELPTDHHSTDFTVEEYMLNKTSHQQEPTAYCNLCERSFCNKYFLKTHFVKKHGGLQLTSPLSMVENADHLKMSLSPSSPCLSNEQTSIVNQRSSPLPNNKTTEDYCEICQKHFCNKYYLRKHKGECHGIYTDYIRSLQKSTKDSSTKANTSHRPPPSLPVPSNTLLLNPFYPGPSDIKSLFPIASSPDLNHQTKSPKSSPQRSIRRCKQCDQEFRNRSLFRMHMNTFHPNEKNKKLFSTSPPMNMAFVPSFVDTSSQLAQTLATGHGSQTPYGIVHDSYFSAKMADRVVCELCNKQVCNKYFLKTHKAKVHGITSNEIQEQINENIDNSHSYCSLCQKDFPTKYLYLFHMQTIHNDTSDPTYQTLIQLMKKATAMNENSNPVLSLAHVEQSGDEADGNEERCKRKRSLSQSSNDSPAKHLNSLTENNAGLQPFLLESEDPKFSHTFVPCMVYLPVVRRVTKQVKINLRLKPVLADASS